MNLKRIEDGCTVLYENKGEVVGVIRYRHPTPSSESLSALAKRIAQLYKESFKKNNQ